MCDCDITRIEALDLKPGDILLVSTPRHISYQEATRIRHQFLAAIPDGVDLVVAANDLTTSVYRPALDGEAAAQNA